MSSIQEKAFVKIGMTKNNMNPVILESPHEMWVFIRKVYSILAIQLTLVIVVGSVVLVVPFVKDLIVTTTQTKIASVLYVVCNFLPLTVFLLLNLCHRKHPYNFILLTVFTLAFAFMAGSNCSSSNGVMILQVIVLLLVVIMSLILYTFWGAKKGFEFRFLGPFFFAVAFVVIAFFIGQIIFPVGIRALFQVVVGLSFCAYVVYVTSVIIKHLSYDEYIWGSARIHVDIIPIIISILTCKRVAYR